MVPIPPGVEDQQAVAIDQGVVQADNATEATRVRRVRGPSPKTSVMRSLASVVSRVLNGYGRSPGRADSARSLPLDLDHSASHRLSEFDGPHGSRHPDPDFRG